MWLNKTQGEDELEKKSGNKQGLWNQKIMVAEILVLKEPAWYTVDIPRVSFLTLML